MTAMPPIRIKDSRVLSDDYYLLKKTTFEIQRRDGSWVTTTRETYDRGNGCCILLYDPAQGTVLLTRQFRFPAYVNGHAEPLIEVCAGLLDAHDPETAIVKEAAEECGVTVTNPKRVFECFMSPGSVTERVTFFIAEYSPLTRTGTGGGLIEEGEDIEVIELTLEDALAMVGDGRICDAKTIMLLQYAALHKVMG
ncbi:NUDIX domain-containing protein [Dongia sp.]|uniref:NUDIX domain-containing protein n=1 Tax=Dongia sp. TaxID=1977262 RepID=UPI0035AF7821